jgi:CRISPR system Cascade subunit CasB
MSSVDSSAENVIQDAAAPTHGEPFGALAYAIQRAPLGERAALARLQPEALQPHQLAALSRALIAAGLSPGEWSPRIWSRWALIAQGMALTGHDAKQRLGSQLAQACVSESRVTKLLTSRGAAFTQLLPRVLRLLASKSVAPNWRELGELVLKEGSDSSQHLDEAEAIRLRIAGPYFSAMARAAAAK